MIRKVYPHQASLPRFSMPHKIALICASLAISFITGPALAQPAAAINCAVQRLSAKQQAELGTGLADDKGDFASKAQKIIYDAAEACASTNKWIEKQTDAATAWSTWALLIRVIERRSGLTPSDLAIMHTYVDENAAKLDGLLNFTAPQLNQLIATLRQRGVHLHDLGKGSEIEMSVMLFLKEMNTEQANFAAR